MSNDKVIYEKNQACITTFFPISQIIKHDDEFFRTLSRGKRKILDTVIYLSHRYVQVSPSQEKIALLSKVGREYANNVLDQLHRMGLVEKVYRHRQTCIYKISKYFSDPTVRSSLSHYLPSLRTLCISALTVMSLKNSICQQQKFLDHKKMQSRYATPLDLDHRDIYMKPIVDYVTKGVEELKNREQGKKEDEIGAVARDMFGQNPLPAILGEIQGMELTRWGKIKLAAFPDEVLKYAKEAFEKKARFEKIEAPFNFFIKTCLNRCHEAKITPDWGWMKQLAISFEMPDNPVLVMPYMPKPMMPDAPYNPRQETTRISYRESFAKSGSKHSYQGKEVRSSAYTPFEKTVTVKLDQNEVKKEQEKLDAVFETDAHKAFEKILGFSFRPTVPDTKEVVVDKK